MLENDSELVSEVTMLWESMVNLPLEAAAVEPSFEPHTITACVIFAGAWEGALVVRASWSLGEQIASSMCACPNGSLGRDDVLDAFGELVNVLGGRLKRNVKGHCTSSVPRVVEGIDYAITLPMSRDKYKRSFTCFGDALSVVVRERVAGDIAELRARKAAVAQSREALTAKENIVAHTNAVSRATEVHDELNATFLREAREWIEAFEALSSTVKATQNGANALEEMFRAVHNLKGASALYGYAKLAAFADTVDDLLRALRDGELSTNATTHDALASAADSFRRLLDEARGGAAVNADELCASERAIRIARG